MDSQRSASQRVRAVQSLPAEQSETLYGLIWSSGHPMPVRIAAVDRLIAIDAARFWDGVDRRIQRIDDWPMISLLCQRAAEDGEKAFVPAAVKSWARPSTLYPDEDRPERATIERLSVPLAVERVIEGLCLGPETAGADDPHLRLAAWTVYSRIASDDRQRRVIAARKDGDGFLGGLAIIEPAVDVLPADREGMLRLATLVESSSPARWQACIAYRARWGNEPMRGIAARHLPAIDHAGDRLVQTRGQMYNELLSGLSGARHVSRGEAAGDEYVTPRPEGLADYADEVSHADLLILLLIHDAMGSPALISELFTQARQDRDDTTTEYGGVLRWDDAGAIQAKLFAPAMRRHDQVFFASDACIKAMHTGLAHYHFHTQKESNAVWAGPGGGDLKFADALHANCVVFTSVDRDTLNVDVYFPGGVIVDLGCITRP